MDDQFKTIRFWVFIVSFVVVTTMGAFNIFATNKRVDLIDGKVKHSKNILCAMAIDFKWANMVKACNEEK